MAYASAVVRCLCFVGPVLQETTLWACCLDPTYEIEKYKFYKEQAEFEKNKVAEIKEQAVNELNCAVILEENKLLKQRLMECELYIDTQSKVIKTKKRKHKKHENPKQHNYVERPTALPNKTNKWFCRSNENINNSKEFKNFIRLYRESQTSN